MNGRQDLRILLPSTFCYGDISRVRYVTKLNNIKNLKQRIRHEIRKITPEILKNVRDVCYHRFAICQETNGAHFEHFLYYTIFN
jgi:hypothetical protein